jgi:hypothetical protein
MAEWTEMNAREWRSTLPFLANFQPNGLFGQMCYSAKWVIRPNGVSANRGRIVISTQFRSFHFSHYYLGTCFVPTNVEKTNQTNLSLFVCRKMDEIFTQQDPTCCIHSQPLPYSPSTVCRSTIFFVFLFFFFNRNKKERWFMEIEFYSHKKCAGYILWYIIQRMVPWWHHHFVPLYTYRWGLMAVERRTRERQREKKERIKMPGLAWHLN